jgi:hypothetical protein
MIRDVSLGSRIRDVSLGSRIPGPGFFPSLIQIPDPGPEVKKTLDPGPATQIRLERGSQDFML